MKYVDIPNVTTYDEVVGKEYSLSASQYKRFNIPNKNVVSVRDLLSRGLTNEDLGTEVGSNSYFDAGPKQFIKAGALQSESYLLDINKESVKNIIPQSFVSMNLKKGDVIVSKDSNVGEVVILDKDYPDAMLSGALYRLPVKEHKYYLLAMMKSNLFREQIDFIVPRGATIRHGKTKFLDAQIPLPNKRKDETINYVEQITKAIVEKQQLINHRYCQAISLIENEIKFSQKEDLKFCYQQPTFNNLIKYGRIDSAIYSYGYQHNMFLIRNYKLGTVSIDEFAEEPIRGQNLQVSNIGTSIYSDKALPNFYTLLRPKNITLYGTADKYEYLGNKNKLLCLNVGDVVFGAEATFRSFVFIDTKEKVITNIHGVIFPQKKHNVVDGITLKFLLDYYREKGILRACAVGGNGGSLAIKYFHLLAFPKFNDCFKKKLSSLYYSSSQEYNPSKCNVSDFRSFDDAYNQTAGIYELDKSMRYLREKLKQAIEDIACNREVKCKF